MSRSNSNWKLKIISVLTFITSAFIFYKSSDNIISQAENTTIYRFSPASLPENASPFNHLISLTDNKQPILDKKSQSSSFTNTIKNPENNILCKLNLKQFCVSNHIAEVLDSFWIIAPIYSFYQGSISKMYQLHMDFENYMESLGLPFCTLEAIRKDRNQKYIVTESGKEPHNIQIEFYDDLYLRENFINVAVKKIPDWEYIAWIDGHQVFENPYWWEESIYNMEKVGSVQLFQVLKKLKDDNSTLNVNPGSIYVSLLHSRLGWNPFPYYGNAFAIRREMYEGIGYIADECIAGCCDCVYNYGLMDEKIDFYYMNRWPNYQGQFIDWVKNAQKVFKGKRKSIRGDLIHLHHEEKFSYGSLLDEMNKMNFEKKRDVTRDDNFTIKLTNDKIREKFDHINFISYYIIRIIVGCILLGIVVLGCIGFAVKKYCFKDGRRYEVFNN